MSALALSTTACALPSEGDELVEDQSAGLREASVPATMHAQPATWTDYQRAALSLVHEDGTGEEPPDTHEEGTPNDDPEVTGEGLDEEPLPEPAEDGSLPEGAPQPPALPPEDVNPDGSLPNDEPGVSPDGTHGADYEGEPASEDSPAPNEPDEDGVLPDGSIPT